jgi:hypothetical protein
VIPPTARAAPKLLAIPLMLFVILSTGPSDQASSQTAVSGVARTVMSGGGAARTGGSYVTVGTMGQPSPVGVIEGRNVTLYSGFWGPGNTPVSDVDLPAPVTRLEQNFPNPFNPSTRIDYSLAADRSMTIEVFNVQGRRVRVLVAGPRTAGPHQVVWYGRDDLGRQVASGVYFYRLQAGQHRELKRMLLLK